MTEQMKYPEALEQLRAAYEHEKIQLTAHISTLEVTVSQLTIKVKGQQGKIKKLEEQLEKAQDIVSDNVQTILRLQKCTDLFWLEEMEGEKNNA